MTTADASGIARSPTTAAPRRRSWVPRVGRVYILPTPFGALYGAALFLMLLMAYTYQNNLAYALTFFLGSFGLTSMFATHRLMQRLEIETRAGTLQIEGKAFASPVTASVRDLPAGAVVFAPRGSGVFSAHDGEWIARRRGVHDLTMVEGRTTFPSGLFRAWKRWPVRLSVIAAPRAEDAGLNPRGQGAGDEEDELLRREPEELRELAPARDEESIARVDWKSLARGRGRLKKEFEAPAEPPFEILWSATEPLEDVERRLRQMSAWIQAAPQGARARVQLPDGRWTERREDALRTLARHPFAPEVP